MKKWNIYRIVREDTVVEADTIEEAMLLAPNVDASKWDCYDCEYWRDDEIL